MVKNISLMTISLSSLKIMNLWLGLTQSRPNLKSQLWC